MWICNARTLTDYSWNYLYDMGVKSVLNGDQSRLWPSYEYTDTWYPKLVANPPNVKQIIRRIDFKVRLRYTSFEYQLDITKILQSNITEILQSKLISIQVRKKEY